jgi:hypothetical protein
MDYYQLNAFITTVLLFILAFIPIIKDKNNKLYLWLSFLNLCGALWQFDLFLLRSVQTVEQANIVSRILRPFMLLVPFAFSNFSSLMVKKNINNKINSFLFFSTILSIFLNVTGIGFVGCEYDNFHGFIPKLDIIYVIFIFNVILGVGTGFFILVRKYNDVEITTIERKQIQYFVLGTFIALIGGIINILNITGAKIYPVGTFGLLIYFILITYSILSYNLLDIRVLFQKFFIYVACSFIIVFIFFIADKYLFELIPNIYYKIFLFSLITFLIVISIEPTFRFLEKITHYFLFISYYDYQTLLQFVLTRIRMIKEVDKILLEVLKLSSDVMKLKYNSIFYFDFEKNKYRLFNLEGKKEEFVDKDHALIKYAKKNKDVFYFKKISDDYNYDLSLKNEYKEMNIKELYEMLKKNKAEFCLPIIINNEFMGVWIVGEKVNRNIISQEEVKWITNLAFQMGIIIENIILFEQLLQSHRFATLGKMSAAVAHEIRNPISGLYSFIQMILNKKDENTVNKFFDIASDEFKRIERLTTNLLSLGHATKLKKENANINELIKQVNEILSVNLKKARINLIEKYEKLPVIKIDKEMIKQVLLNLVLNSIQAMPGGGNIEIGTKVEDENILIYIKDEGIGIIDEIKDRVFEPFFTTKADGSGIGLTLAKNIIDAHAGNISFESVKNKGSIFYIRLPMEL